MRRNVSVIQCSMHLRLTGVVDVNEWVSVVDEVLGFTDL